MGGELRRDVTLALETDAAADLLLLFNLFPTPTAFTHFSSLVSLSLLLFRLRPTSPLRRIVHVPHRLR
jgi:hypothetical protein